MNKVFKQEVTVTFTVLMDGDDSDPKTTWDEVGQAAIEAVSRHVATVGFSGAKEVYAHRGPGGRGLYTDSDSVKALFKEPHITASFPRHKEV